VQTSTFPLQHQPRRRSHPLSCHQCRSPGPQHRNFHADRPLSLLSVRQRTAGNEPAHISPSLPFKNAKDGVTTLENAHEVEIAKIRCPGPDSKAAAQTYEHPPQTIPMSKPSRSYFKRRFASSKAFHWHISGTMLYPFHFSNPRLISLCSRVRLAKREFN